MQAIVLQRTDFREYDQLISLYTRELGRLDVVARGVKKIKSKNTSHLEPCSFVSVEIVPGKQYSYVTTVVPIMYFSGVRGSYERVRIAQVCVGLIFRMTKERMPDERVFELLYSVLSYLEGSAQPSVTIIDAFVMKLMGLFGFEPQLSQCVVCEKTYADMMKEYFAESSVRTSLYFAGGGLLCGSCTVDKKRIGEEVCDAGLKEISDMNMSMQSTFGVVGQFLLSDQERLVLHELVYKYVLYHVEVEVVDWIGVL